MALETGTYINDLVATNPTSTDPKSEGDNHIRLVKSTIKATFPNVTGAVTPTQGQLNVLVAYSGQNRVINGNFGINQRAYVSGAATTAGQYTLDRWKVTGTGGVTFSTTANKTTVTIPVGQTLQQVVEGLSLESGTYVLSWDGTAQGRIGSGSYGASGTVTASVTGGTNTTIEFNAGTVAQVMFEKGSVASAFQHRPYAAELLLCQRYYYRVSVFVGHSGFGVTSTQARFSIPFPATMRIIPTALEQSGTATQYVVVRNAGTLVTSNAVPTYIGASESAAQIRLDFASGITAGEGLQSAGAAGSYLGFSTEL